MGRQKREGSTPWDITTGVGLTALGVAAGRAIETHRPDGLVNDPFAEAFVAAAGMQMPTRARTERDGGVPWESLATYMGIRSRFFDDFFATAAADGLNQVVLLAAGLDTRAYRLEWPQATIVYEVDAPKVLEFKDTVLAEQSAHARCDRRAVAADLREDWSTELQQAGFDPAKPTAWLAEGLLPFLPDEAKQHLFTSLQTLSAFGSRIAVEHLSGNLATLLQAPIFDDIAQHFDIDMTQLWPTNQHFDTPRWLAEHAWSVTTEHTPDLGQRYGRTLDQTLQRPMRTSILLTAEHHTSSH